MQQKRTKKLKYNGRWVEIEEVFDLVEKAKTETLTPEENSIVSAYYSLYGRSWYGSKPTPLSIQTLIMTKAEEKRRRKSAK